MKQKDIIEINGKKYALVPDTIGDGSECDRCALCELCHDDQDLICRTKFGDEYAQGKNFIEVDENALTEEKVYDYYQERSVTAGSRADQMAWMFILMMTGGLISGHAYTTFSVCAALSAIYVFCSIMQAVWQTFTSWLFLQRVKKSDVVPEDYPSWVGGGAWFFFWLKMIAISAAVFYFVHAIFE
jgi:hypothetical protein